MNVPEREPRLRLGIISRTHGLTGQLRCVLATAETPRVAVPCPAWIGYSARFVQPIRLLESIEHGDAILCRFEGFATPEAAAVLVDQALFVDWDSVSFEDQEADARLIGYRVVDESGEQIGELVEIMSAPAQFIWTVLRNGREWLMPAVPEFIRGYDHEARTVTLRPIPGLFEEIDDDQDARGDGRTA